jgi:hypothetical protein
MRMRVTLFILVGALTVWIFRWVSSREEVPLQSRNPIETFSSPTNSRLQVRNRVKLKSSPDFLAELSSAWQKLPRWTEIANETDFHRTPSTLLAVTPQLGRISDTLRADPNQIPNGLRFYKDCANETEIHIAIRALCLRDYLYWSKQIHRPSPLTDFDADVVSLAEKAPPLLFGPLSAVTPQTQTSKE